MKEKGPRRARRHRLAEPLRALRFAGPAEEGDSRDGDRGARDRLVGAERDPRAEGRPTTAHSVSPETGETPVRRRLVFIHLTARRSASPAIPRLSGP